MFTKLKFITGFEPEPSICQSIIYPLRPTTQFKSAIIFGNFPNLNLNLYLQNHIKPSQGHPFTLKSSKKKKREPQKRIVDDRVKNFFSLFPFLCHYWCQNKMKIFFLSLFFLFASQLTLLVLFCTISQCSEKKLGHKKRERVL